ncbi:DUF2163 domain-containing protein [Tranquillimonas rosea]|uniref:DUF2163 domain-containing protein n=1 Tax=Tranquillimonas rosea TaxID=641238 RepID=UPI003BAAF14C
MSALETHLAGGVTTLCRCWRLVRRDGVTLGFTDHDQPVRFDGAVFAPQGGLSGLALAQGTGLSVDNSEAEGVLSAEGLREEDIRAGRYDGCGVEVWQVNWADAEMRRCLFRGTLGEITRAGGAFRAELRGLTEALNQPQGRIFQRRCGAVLGDAACGVDLGAEGRSAERTLEAVEEGWRLHVRPVAAVAEGWFEGGRVVALSGMAEGVSRRVKIDRAGDGLRELVLWDALPGLAVGDRVRLEVGCDKSPGTCRDRFGNLLNFRGFPHLPSEDWLMVHPARADRVDVGSRAR